MPGLVLKASIRNVRGMFLPCFGDGCLRGHGLLHLTGLLPEAYERKFQDFYARNIFASFEQGGGFYFAE